MAKSASQVPPLYAGPLGLWWATSPLPVLNQMYVAPIGRFRLLRDTLYLVSDPAIAHQLLVEAESDGVLGKSPRLTQVVQMLMGIAPNSAQPLLTAAGEEWMNLRRQLGGAHSPNNVAGYTTRIAKVANNLIGGLDLTKPVNLSNLADQIAAQTVLDLMLPQGRELPANLLELISAIDTVTKYVLARLRNPLTPLNWRLRQNYNAARRVIGQTTSEIYELLIAEAAYRGTLLEGILHGIPKNAANSNQQLTVVNQILTTIIAGQETTAQAMQWLWVLMAQNPELWRAVIQEARSTADPVALVKGSLLRSCIDESLRLYPPVMVLGRQLGAPLELGDYHFAAGSVVLVLPYVIQRNPAFWGDDAGTFRPGRWEDLTPNTGGVIHYLPFGAGPRTCLGMHLAITEMVVATWMLLGQHDVRIENPDRVGMKPTISAGVDRPVMASIRPQ